VLTFWARDDGMSVSHHHILAKPEVVAVGSLCDAVMSVKRAVDELRSACE
jgi:hypothetical protein